MKKNELKSDPNQDVGASKPSNKADVLYQKLGNTWYAFSSINGDMYFGKVPGDAADDHTGEIAEFDMLDLMDMDEETLEAIEAEELKASKKLVA